MSKVSLGCVEVTDPSRQNFLNQAALLAMQKLLLIQPIKGGTRITCNVAAAWDVAEQLYAEGEARKKRKNNAPEVFTAPVENQ